MFPNERNYCEVSKVLAKQLVSYAYPNKTGRSKYSEILMGPQPHLGYEKVLSINENLNLP